jgi:glucosamine 6-phosphate synthetase-like amidotransferase/phosphosugar isomerase protein
MCEMCGYVGRKKAAAPILLEYGKRVEGLWSGYITGIGVQDADGSLEMKKTLGYSKYWEEKFDASAMKGTVGFFHSRTGAAKGVGHERYGHPYPLERTARGTGGSCGGDASHGV